MQIKIKLNNKNRIINASYDESLLSILRKENCFSVKCGCEKGQCGTCTVLVNDNPVASCIIPVGSLNSTDDQNLVSIVTMEHFESYEEFKDISKGFKDAKISLCGYCDSAKIFTAYSLIKKYYRPTKEQIEASIKYLQPCCIDNDTFMNGIIYAVAANHRREGKAANEK